jgi:hypothetical protein
MKQYGDFSVGKCGNAEVYFLFDSLFFDDISLNIWSLDSNGYVCRNKNGKLERLHSVVYEKYTGCKTPNGMHIDHINKCKTDNRICNLRVVTPSENIQNLPLRANNKTGYIGVSKAQKGGKGYRAYITVNKIRIDLGTYSTIEKAVSARKAAEKQLGFKGNQTLEDYIKSKAKTKTEDV